MKYLDLLYTKTTALEEVTMRMRVKDHMAFKNERVWTRMMEVGD